ncbi:cytochrome b N-terminal domain-containing protein [Prolixibacteraceae bacterium Z1-6]|uniref:Cytochrome b N-terminal domain-containing protein n=1 Tax=Draconibacterium aestuarii TaxID=2998507 RepID=A0A9X3J754_9BACT|nr:cytochrome b N-terminal domain-containing protein [Prolixibacteraceae bacterium Z1-6]
MDKTLKSGVKNRKRKGKTTFGTYAIALFWLVIVSGIFLAIPFDVEDPYLSVSTMMISNPWASLIRNLHYWSSQFFLILSLIHLYDHFHYKKRIGLKKGIAFRLSIGVLIIFLAMITGFLLKGDSDSEQARQILETLAERVPLIGKALAFSLIGASDSYQLIYVHHIATFTVFMGIIIVEHSKIIWPRYLDFIVSFAATFIVSFLFSAPLHDNLNPTVKGPWYFVGFQEILHWLKHPEWSLLLFLILIVLIYLVNSAKKRISFITKRGLLVFTGFYLILTIIGLFFRGERWAWTYPGQPGYTYSVLHNFKTTRVNLNPEFEIAEATNAAIIQGRKESCLACHTGTTGFSTSHDPDAIGCASCHGGNPFTTHKNESHRNMVLIPGNLATAPQSCGTTECHPEIVERVPTGLMSTLSGMISVDRFVFNEQDNPDILTNVHQLGNTPADEHLRNLCVRCHLGNPKTEFGPVNESSRGGGCLACHLNYSPEAEKALAFSHNAKVKAHPSIDLQISNNHCFGCHSRSGRISTNYEGWHETTLEKEEMPDSSNYRLVEGFRVFTKKQEDVHHQLGLECVDCHHSYEVMGDGNLYAHQENQQDVSCADCHVYEKPNTISAENLDNESALIAALRFNNVAGREFLVTQKHKRALINTSVESDSIYFLKKNTGEKIALTAPASICVRNNAHSNLSCSSCHTAWAPTCIGCHNLYDSEEPSYNMIKNEEQKGGWVELIGEYLAKPPTLGVRKSDDKDEIIPVVPGMILTIDKQSYTGNENDPAIFHRLYAPSAPHTTSSKGRSCKSCHNDPVALGFGEGELTYTIDEDKGKWEFDAFYENDKHDNLPADAWTGFLQNRSGAVSTRSDVFPFTIEQQKAILTTGACLTCHEEDSKVMLSGLDDFEKQLGNRSSKCVLPEWE